MKKTIKLAVLAAMLLGSTSAFATNGSALIATGAKARGMGGTGIGVAHGAESALANSALITSVKDTEISFGGTIFMPKVQNDMGAGFNESSADINVIPSVSIANKVNDNFYWGIGMWGTAGMGVDYRDEASNMKMVTNLQLMQFAVPLAYTTNNFSIAFTPLLQYGSLDIQYDGSAMGGGPTGSGVSQDLEFGYNIGLAYELSGLTIGAVYKSQIDMEYKGQISTAMAGLGETGSDKLSTPAEIGAGISYNMKEHTIALDYKQIKWSSAKGYEDFGWEDQSVYALGYEFATDNYSARLGYNYAKSPISSQGTTPGSLETKLNTFNLVGFPAIVESHITVGGSLLSTKRLLLI